MPRPLGVRALGKRRGRRCGAFYGAQSERRPNPRSLILEGMESHLDGLRQSTSFPIEISTRTSAAVGRRVGSSDLPRQWELQAEH